MPTLVNSTSLLHDNCTLFGNASVICYRQMLQIVGTINNELWKEYKNSWSNKVGADIFTIVILGVFAIVLFGLMIHSVQQEETVDDQVSSLLASMQIHVDYEEHQRQLKRMKEDKKRAMSRLNNSKIKTSRKLSRSASYRAFEVRTSICSVPTPKLLPISRQARTRSYQGFLPEIVVTNELLPSIPSTMPSSSNTSLNSQCSRVRQPNSSHTSLNSPNSPVLSISSVNWDRESNNVFLFPEAYIP